MRGYPLFQLPLVLDFVVLIVIANHLPDNIRSLERHSIIDSSILAVATDDNGIWPSSANTINPNGGTSEIVLTSSDVPIGTISNLYSFNNGWNMISLPLVVNDPRKIILFPTATSNAFLYIPGTGYAQKDTIYNGIGYWLKFNADQTIPLEGIQILSVTIDVVEGWNLIGCISETVLVSNITSEPENIITSNFYGYNNGYFITTELLPARAYWVKVNQNGKLFLNVTKK